MKKHLIPDRSALPRIPYRLLIEGWWLAEDFCSDNTLQPTGLGEERHLCSQEREVQKCN